MLPGIVTNLMNMQAKVEDVSTDILRGILKILEKRYICYEEILSTLPAALSIFGQRPPDEKWLHGNLSADSEAALKVELRNRGLDCITMSV